jgi:hypothetical protein
VSELVEEFPTSPKLNMVLNCQCCLWAFFFSNYKILSSNVKVIKKIKDKYLQTEGKYLSIISSKHNYLTNNGKQRGWICKYLVDENAHLQKNHRCYFYEENINKQWAFKKWLFVLGGCFFVSSSYLFSFKKKAIKTLWR